MFRSAEQFTPEAQRFLSQFRVLRTFGDGALERLDQLGDSREDRAVVGDERRVAILQPGVGLFFPALDGFLGSLAKRPGGANRSIPQL